MSNRQKHTLREKLTKLGLSAAQIAVDEGAKIVITATEDGRVQTSIKIMQYEPAHPIQRCRMNDPVEGGQQAMTGVTALKNVVDS